MIFSENVSRSAQQCSTVEKAELTKLARCFQGPRRQAEGEKMVFI
jgi:hypothetical protein